MSCTYNGVPYKGDVHLLRTQCLSEIDVEMQAEAAAAAGESSFRSFMVAVQRCGSSVAIVQQVCWLVLTLFIFL
jgi:hypothetical protein